MAIHILRDPEIPLILDDENLYPEGVSTDWEVIASNDDIIDSHELEFSPVRHAVSTITMIPVKWGMSDAIRDAIETLFGRTYVTPTEIDPGFITEDIEYEIIVWNADNENLSELTSIAVDSADGLSLVYPTLPKNISRGGDEVLDLTIELEGPPIQNSTYTIVAGGLTYSVTVAGIRAIGLEVNPCWDRKIAVVYSFLTAIGANPRYYKEQRRPLSRYPWRDISVYFDVKNLKAQAFQNSLHYGHDKVFVVPLYNEQITCVTLAVGNTSITPVEDFSEYYNLNNNCTHLIFLDEENDLVEIKEIDTIGATTISFATTIQNTFDANSTLIYPGVFSVLQSVAQVSETQELQRYKLNFQEFKKNG